MAFDFNPNDPWELRFADDAGMESFDNLFGPQEPQPELHAMIRESQSDTSNSRKQQIPIDPALLEQPNASTVPTIAQTAAPTAADPEVHTAMPSSHEMSPPPVSDPNANKPPISEGPSSPTAKTNETFSDWSGSVPSEDDLSDESQSQAASDTGAASSKGKSKKGNSKKSKPKPAARKKVKAGVKKGTARRYADNLTKPPAGPVTPHQRYQMGYTGAPFKCLQDARDSDDGWIPECDKSDIPVTEEEKSGVVDQMMIALYDMSSVEDGLMGRQLWYSKGDMSRKVLYTAMVRILDVMLELYEIGWHGWKQHDPTIEDGEVMVHLRNMPWQERLDRVLDLLRYRKKVPLDAAQGYLNIMHNFVLAPTVSLQLRRESDQSNRLRRQRRIDDHDTMELHGLPIKGSRKRGAAATAGTKRTAAEAQEIEDGVEEVAPPPAKKKRAAKAAKKKAPVEKDSDQEEEQDNELESDGDSDAFSGSKATVLPQTSRKTRSMTKAGGT